MPNPNQPRRDRARVRRRLTEAEAFERVTGLVTLNPETLESKRPAQTEPGS